MTTVTTVVSGEARSEARVGVEAGAGRAVGCGVAASTGTAEMLVVGLL